MKKKIVLLALASLSLSISCFAQDRNHGQRGGEEHGRVGGDIFHRTALRRPLTRLQRGRLNIRCNSMLQNSMPHTKRNSATSVILKGIRTRRMCIPTASGLVTIWVVTIGAIIWIIPGSMGALR